MLEGPIATARRGALYNKGVYFDEKFIIRESIWGHVYQIGLAWGQIRDQLFQKNVCFQKIRRAAGF